VLESGWLAIAPPLAAALGSVSVVLITAALCRRFGDRWGYRLVPLDCHADRRRIAVGLGGCGESLFGCGGARRVFSRP